MRCYLRESSISLVPPEHIAQFREYDECRLRVNLIAELQYNIIPSTSMCLEASLYLPRKTQIVTQHCMHNVSLAGETM